MAKKNNAVAAVAADFEKLFTQAKRSLHPKAVSGDPKNFVTGNVVVKDEKQANNLAFVAAIEGYSTNLWATANQIRKAGGNLKPEAYGVPCFMPGRYYRVYNYDSVNWGDTVPSLKVTPTTTTPTTPTTPTTTTPVRGKHFRREDSPATTTPKTTTPKTNAEAPKAEACIPTNDEPIVVRLPEYGIYVSGRTNAQVRKALEAAVEAYKILASLN